MCTHRESGQVEAGPNAEIQMDRGGRRERKDFSVFCDVRAYVSCRGYAGIPERARRSGRESRWHREAEIGFSLVLDKDRQIIC